MWSLVVREVSKHPLNTLDSLRSKVSEVMADMDRKVVICPCKELRSRIEAIVGAVGISLIKCVCDININFV
jgi:hypothetical protein